LASWGEFTALGGSRATCHHSETAMLSFAPSVMFN
jgi:hypothetical protein